MFSIWIKHGAGYQELVSFLESPHGLTCCRIPQASRAVAAGGHDLLTIAGEPRGKNCIFMAGKHGGMQNADFFIPANVPEPHAFIVATGKDHFSIGRKSARPHTAAVAAQRFHGFAGGEIPNANRVVFAAAEYQLAFGRERNAANRAVVPGEPHVIWLGVGLTI